MATNRFSSVALVLSGLCWFSPGCTEQASGPPATEKPAAQPVQPTLPTPAPKVAEPVAPLVDAHLGNAAPDFTLNDTDGKAHTLSALKGKTVVLEWFNPDCPFIKYAHGEGPLKTQASKLMGDSLVWLSINSSAPGKQGHGIERNKAAKIEYAMQNAILLDESGQVGKQYGAQKTPHMFIVDKTGTLIYRGGLDNAPIGSVDAQRPRLPDSKEGALINYIDAAVEDLDAKRALRLNETPAYGCSVKYQS